MAHVTARQPLAQRLHWDDRIKPWLVRLAFAAVGALIALYVIAPAQSRGSDNHLPTTFTRLPVGTVTLTTETGDTAILPVRIADTADARANALKNVGPLALSNSFLLYGQTRETTGRTTYNFEGVRVPLELAIVSAEGEVLAIQQAGVGSGRVTVAEKHRWVLATKAGTFEPYGITVGSRLDPEAIRKLNL